MQSTANSFSYLVAASPGQGLRPTGLKCPSLPRPRWGICVKDFVNVFDSVSISCCQFL